MKTSFVFAIVFALMFLGAGLAKAQDDGMSGIGDLADGVDVGAEVKLYIYDQTDGTSDGVSQSNDVSAGISSAIVYLSKQITDKLSATLDIELLVHAGATPRLGGEITRESDEVEIETEFLRANITYVLPQGFEVKAGYLKPLFTWDYGYEAFWHETYHATYVTANPWLGSWHDSGVELYKSFDMESASIPVYLYLLNGPGQGLVDNNEGMSVLLHAQPELMGGKVKLLGSYAFGKWDDDNSKDFSRYAVGADVTAGNFNVRGEYMGGQWDDKFLVAEAMTRNVEPKGYYVKAFYHVLPKLKVLVGYSHLEHDFSGFFFTASGVGEEYDTVTLGLDYSLADDVTAMLQWDNVDGTRDDGSADLEFDRVTLGVRATF